ncbi:hypothetical protein POVCU2_0025010 [Plasmodium ovale curtisi]|uniref:Uncharacterized protein n=1 Tax=Plasmodium ovale curtisi TaxID=864141 RepID=A0A1A8WHE5_PLAOA|nr:hypothetical protein POVCU2_0025010 [Plasmodium ovale curtisi]SBS92374.1 hypothetical protein POVCU1_022770 [Plasmodium ovale curtisi]
MSETEKYKNIDNCILKNAGKKKKIRQNSLRHKRFVSTSFAIKDYHFSPSITKCNRIKRRNAKEYEAKINGDFPIGSFSFAASATAERRKIGRTEIRLYEKLTE